MISWAPGRRDRRAGGGREPNADDQAGTVLMHFHLAAVARPDCGCSPQPIPLPAR